MAKFGELKEFRPEDEKIGVYLERVQLYFQANDVKETKKVPVLLSTVGPHVYQLLHDLLSPANPKDSTLEALFKQLTDHYEPKPIVIAERFIFYQRNQKLQESVTTYLAELRRLATNCKFEGFLSSALRDRFVCGLRDSATQKRLLAEADLKLDKAIEIAQGMEAADLQTKRFQTQVGSPPETEPPSTVGKVHQPSQGRRAEPPEQERRCYRCGAANHLANSCKFLKSKCMQCGKIGHIKRVCRSKPTEPAPVCSVEEEEDDYVDLKTVTATQGQLTRVPPFRVSLMLDKLTVSMEIDTGASYSLVSETTYQELWPDRGLDKSIVKLCTYSGEALEVLGSIPVVVEYENQLSRELLLVVKGTVHR